MKEFYQKYKSKINIILFFIEGLIIFYFIIWISVGDPRYLKDSRKELKRNQEQIDSAKKEVEYLNNRISYFESRDSIYLSEINKNKNNIKNQEKNLNEKINIVDSYDINTINQFLTDRYKDSI